MTSHNDVIQSFIKGEDAKGHNITTYELSNGVRVLEGYDWAAYAAIKGRTAVVFEQWRGYSVTTSKHMGMTQGALRSALKRGDIKLREYAPEQIQKGRVQTSQLRREGLNELIDKSQEVKTEHDY